MFAWTCYCIASMLHAYQGKINFTTDVWPSPNHHAFVAFCVHLEHKGCPLSFLLDIVEVAEVWARFSNNILAYHGSNEVTYWIDNGNSLC